MNDELQDRLRALGTHPVDEATHDAHLRRLDAVSADPGASVPRRRFGAPAVAAAAIVGFLAGSTGLAMAGALPDTAQGVAHDVLGVVRVDVPSGKEGKRGPCVSEAAKIEDKEAKQAAKDACPKGGPVDTDEAPPGDPPGRSGDAPGRSGDAPGRSGDAPGRSGDAPGKSGDVPRGTSKHDDDPCRGRPPWAGPMPKEERAELKDANSRADCVDDDTAAVDDEIETQDD